MRVRARLIGTSQSPNAGSITGAPLAIDDMVITGIAGGDYGVSGFIEARDAASGKQRWRFNTAPKVGEPGSETWGGHDGTGSATWLTGSYDPELRLIYWGVGNPSPSFNGDVRPGDNLYSNSVVALDADSGKLRWHFQFTPHDLHDWDAIRFQYLSMLPSVTLSVSCSRWPIEMAFTICSIAPKARFCSVHPL